MLDAVRYLLGSVGPSGYGSKSTAEQVTESCADLRSITAIITGNACPTWLNHESGIIAISAGHMCV